MTVLNFLDPTNRADRRLYDSLNQKLKRFDRLFGASESVLGRAGPDADAAPRTAEEVRADREAAREARQKEFEREEKRAEADLLSHFDDEVRARFKWYGESVPKALSRMEGWLWALTKHKLAHRAAFNETDRSFVLDKSPFPGLRLSRITFGMDKARPVAERYRINHPLARRVLADCLEGRLERGRLTLKARGAFVPGMEGEVGLWLAGMATEATTETHSVLCGLVGAGRDARTLTPDECAELMKLPVLACHGGVLPAEPGEAYRGRVWRDGGTASDREPLCGEALARARDRALEAARRRFLTERDTELNTEFERLRHWAQDEEHALSLRQEEKGRKIKALKEKAAATTTFVERFQWNQQAALLEKERAAEEERLFYLAAEIRQKRDALMDAARAKTTAKFWDEELFVLRFTITDGRNR